MPPKKSKKSSLMPPPRTTDEHGVVQNQTTGENGEVQNKIFIDASVQILGHNNDAPRFPAIKREDVRQLFAELQADQRPYELRVHCNVTVEGDNNRLSPQPEASLYTQFTPQLAPAAATEANGSDGKESKPIAHLSAQPEVAPDEVAAVTGTIEADSGGDEQRSKVQMPTPVSPGQGLAHKNSEASDNILANQSVVHSPPASPSQQMTSPQPAVSPSPRPIIATDKWETVEQTFVLDALKSPRLRRGTYTQTSLTPSEQQKSSGKLSSKRPSRLGHVLSKRPRSRERGPLKQQKRPFLSNLKRSRSPEQLPPMSQQNLEHMPDVPHGQDSPPQTTGGRKSEEEVPESPLKRPRSGTPSHVAETPAVSVTPPNFHETPAVSVMPPNSHGTSATNSVLLTPRETPATNPMRISSILLGGSEGPLHDRFKMLKSTGPQPRGSPHQQADGLQPQTEVPGPKIQQPKEQQSGRQQDDDLVLDEEKSTPRPENPEIINPRRKSRRIAELSEADKQLRYEEKQWERRAKERAQELKIAGLPLPTLFPGPDQ